MEEVTGKFFAPYFITKDPDKGRGPGLYMSWVAIGVNMGGTPTVSNTGGGVEFRIDV
jgi:C4-dicarboxylate-specific signal transduction histidine kinase